MTKYTPEQRIDKFWDRVDSTNFEVEFACWEWTGSKDSLGYGYVWAGKTSKSHRVMWQLVFGEIPDGLWVLHHCDNPSCCNPNHLFLGTHQQNMADMRQKGRSNPKIGESCNLHKLTSAQVAEIRQRYVPRVVTQKQLAQEYGVTQGAIGHILRGLNWKQA